MNAHCGHARSERVRSPSATETFNHYSIFDEDNRLLPVYKPQSGLRLNKSLFYYNFQTRVLLAPSPHSSPFLPPPPISTLTPRTTSTPQPHLQSSLFSLPNTNIHLISDFYNHLLQDFLPFLATILEHTTVQTDSPLLLQPAYCIQQTLIKTYIFAQKLDIMSRNVRQRPNTSHTGQKTPKRSRNTLTSDEDDDYSGVDLISDTEEDEPDVEVAEEQAIIESEEEDDIVNPQPADDEDEFWGPYDSLKGGPDLFPEEQTDQASPADILSGAAEWMGSGDESEPEVTRRVRFDLSDSETVESDIDDNIFPDIFLDQGSLDPGFRRTIENDKNKDNDDSGSDDGSYWDFRGEDEEMGEEEADDEDNKSESSCGSSSGYESMWCRRNTIHEIMLTRLLQPMKVKLLKRICPHRPNSYLLALS